MFTPKEKKGKKRKNVGETHMSQRRIAYSARAFPRNSDLRSFVCASGREARWCDRIAESRERSEASMRRTMRFPSLSHSSFPRAKTADFFPHESVMVRVRYSNLIPLRGRVSWMDLTGFALSFPFAVFSSTCRISNLRSAFGRHACTRAYF